MVEVVVAGAVLVGDVDTVVEAGAEVTDEAAEVVLDAGVEVRVTPWWKKRISEESPSRDETKARTTDAQIA